MTARIGDPRVTFLVLCYNYGRYLGECLGSILGQTVEDFEAIVLDDHSTDETEAVARSIRDPRVRYLRHPTNLGLPENFNAGIRLARGQFVWAVSADDALSEPTALSRALAIFDASPQAGIVWSASWRLGSGAERLAHFDHGDLEQRFVPGELPRRIVAANTMCAPTVVARRVAYDALGVDPFPIELPYIGDWYMWFRLALAAGAVYTPRPLASYRQHGQSMTVAYNSEKHGLYMEERAIFHLWMQRLGPDHRAITHMARRHLVDFLRRRMRTWVAPRATAAEAVAELSMLCGRAARLHGPAVDPRPVLVSCLRVAMTRFLLELVKARALSSFVRAVRLARRLAVAPTP